MPTPLLEDVFKIGGVPTYTFVEPIEFTNLLLAIRSPGRGVVIEGPSGIGKTTAVETAIQKLGLEGAVTKLSARRPADVEYIAQLPTLGKVGVVMIDDFHKLSDSIRAALADYLKTLADAEDRGVKLIVVGINNAGESLIRFASDLVNRVDIVRFESNPDSKVAALITKGEEALNIVLNTKEDIVAAAQGSFYLAQMLSRELCSSAGILEAQPSQEHVSISFEAVRAAVWDRLGLAFRERCERFCRGTRMRSEGRAPYLHILNWVATAPGWTTNIRDRIRSHPELRGSVSQVVEKGYLRDLIANDAELTAVLHFDKYADQLTVEDPQFLYYVRNIPWKQFSKDLGFVSAEFDSAYDFALSFAGADRDVAEALFAALTDREVQVFYDRNEQSRILAEDVEAYLRPIYQSEASFVVALLGCEYPNRVWTKMESEAFKARLGTGTVIPIWFKDCPPGVFDPARAIGSLEFDRSKEMAPQIADIVELLVAKLLSSRK